PEQARSSFSSRPIKPSALSSKGGAEAQAVNNTGNKTQHRVIGRRRNIKLENEVLKINFLRSRNIIIP
ncbi:MAG: hypothetical protein VX167_00950, partial [Pseudomonadota bacterium]|nr:hypothetical protein [Pseudomonadota bacterium]